MEQYTIENSLWIPINDIFSLGVPFPSGNENDVYLNSEERVVYKVNNLINSGNIVNLLNRITAHNNIFPQTKYQLVGFTGFHNRSVMPVIKQNYIGNSEFATPTEIADYMQALGFKKLSDTSFTNGQYIVSDLFPRNVLKSENGNIYVIDDIIKLNKPLSKKTSNPFVTPKVNKGEDSFSDAGRIVEVKKIHNDIQKANTKAESDILFQKKQNELSLQNIITEEGKINYERLNEATDRILGETASLDRLSLAEEQGRRRGGKRNVEASTILSADARTNRTKIQDEGTGISGSQGRGTGRHSGERVSQHTLSTHQEKILKEYAQETGI